MHANKVPHISGRNRKKGRITMALLKKAFYVGLGVAATASDCLSREKIVPVIDKLAARGEAARAEACQSCEQKKTKRKEQCAHVRDLIHTEVDYWKPGSGKFVGREQYEELVARLQKLEGTV